MKGRGLGTFLLLPGLLNKRSSSRIRFIYSVLLLIVSLKIKKWNSKKWMCNNTNLQCKGGMRLNASALNASIINFKFLPHVNRNPLMESEEGSRKQTLTSLKESNNFGFGSTSSCNHRLTTNVVSRSSSKKRGGAVYSPEIQKKHPNKCKNQRISDHWPQLSTISSFSNCVVVLWRWKMDHLLMLLLLCVYVTLVLS